MDGPANVLSEFAMTSLSINSNLARRVTVVIALSGIVSCGHRQVPHGFPSLPTLAISTFPQDAQAEIQQSYAAVRKDPEDAYMNGRLGMLLHANEQPGPATSFYQRAHLLEPREFRWLYLLGVVTANSGHTVEAISLLRQALSLNSSYLSARLKLAECLLVAGDVASSRTAYQELVKTYPADAMVHFGLGRALASIGNRQAAMTEFRKTIHLAPDFGSAHYRLAIALHQAGSAALSAQHMRDYQENKTAAPHEDDPVLREVDGYNRTFAQYARQGNEQQQSRNLALSAQYYEKALKLNPRHVESLASLASVFERMGLYDKAIQQVQAEIRLKPNDGDARYRYGMLLFRKGKRNAATAEFRRAAEIDPVNAKAHDSLGYMLEYSGHPDEALSHYRLAAQFDPELKLARFHYGSLLVKKHRLREGIAEMEKSINPIDKSTPIYLIGLADAYYLGGQPDAAKKALRWAHKLAFARNQHEVMARVDAESHRLGIPTA